MKAANTESSITRLQLSGRNGIALAGDAAGPEDGPLVLFLHGGGQTRHSWGTAQRMMAADGYRVVTFDARGHGESEWDERGDYSLAAFAADLRCVVDRIGRPAALIGASLGGHAAAYAVTQPPRVKAWSLVLVDVVPRINPVGRAHIIDFMGANPDGFSSLAEAAEAISTYLPHRERPPTTSGLGKNLKQRANGRYYWHWDPLFLESRVDPPELMERLEAGLAEIEVPILLVRGGASDVVTDAEASQFRRIVPDAEIANVAKATHMVAGDRNDAFNRSIITFLRRHAQGFGRDGA
jgi:non-heme chloroperoxidase